MWRYSQDERDITIKSCPVCKSVFHIPNEMGILQAYCEECDTDFFFNEEDAIPYKCNNHPSKKNKRGCGCGKCQR